MNIRALDLNLLVALKALLDEKHVSRAATRVGLSQPAMSRALGRLRKLLNDPLLVKGAAGLCLTTRASDLYHSLQNIFIELNQIISPPSFHPATIQSEIVIATRDYETVTVLPALIKTMAIEAPGIKLTVVPLVGDDLTPLDRQEVDFIITGTESKSATLCRRTLFQDRFACLLSTNHPMTQQKFTLEKFTAMKHCLVTISGIGPGTVDTELTKLKLKRNVMVRVSHFLAASYIIADSDLIVTLPRRMGLLMAEHLNINVFEPPIKLPKFAIYLYWHTRNQNNPMHQWIRKCVSMSVNSDA